MKPHTIAADGLHLVLNDHYPIGWDTLKTHEDISQWIAHLIPKRWVTKELLADFIAAACVKNKLKMYL